MKILGIETSCDETAIALVNVAGEDPANFKLLKNEVASQVDTHKEYGGVVPGLAKREHAKNLVPVLLKVLDVHKSEIRNDTKFETPQSDRVATGQANSKFKIRNSKRQKIEDFLSRYPELLEEFKEKVVPLPRPNIDPVSSRARAKSTSPKDRGAATTNGVDLIAVTKGPGLDPALWVGLNFARALSVLWDIPIIGVDHMEGHIAANLLTSVGGNTKSQITIPKQKTNSKSQITNKVQFPAISLAVSGGHTQLILIKDWMDYELLGETVDDAAGEAFDKIARLLGLPFPGGPAIEEKAAQWKSQNPNLSFQINSGVQVETKNVEISVPMPMLKSGDYNFSFSGLKTAVLYDYQSRREDIRNSEEYIEAMAFAVQEAIINVLTNKTKKAAEKYNVKTVMLAGGVAANKELRARLKEKLKKIDKEVNFLVPPPRLSIDNGAMIAIAGYMRYKNGESDDPEELETESMRLITDA